jgi:tagatose 6-phosphate kinase
MILTVTANIALDRTYVVEHLEVGAVHKVSKVFAHTGGKGVNVSRTVASLGGQTLVAGMIGAQGLDEATRELTVSGLASDLHPVSGTPRQTVTVTAQDGTTTAFDEPGPLVSAQEWEDFERHIAGLLDAASILVMSGSLPPGVPDQAYEQLCAAANDHGVPAVVDARGAAMRAAQNQAPWIAKLNRAELEQTVERELTSDEDVVQAALDLRGAGAQNVIVTMGSGGAIAVERDEVWRVTHPVVSGNPIGAGDAFTAGLVLGVIGGKPFEQALRDGAAAALACLRAPTAGGLDPLDFQEALRTVQTQLIDREVSR